MKKVVSDRRAPLDHESEIKPAIRKLWEMNGGTKIADLNLNGIPTSPLLGSTISSCRARPRAIRSPCASRMMTRLAGEVCPRQSTSMRRRRKVAGARRLSNRTGPGSVGFDPQLPWGKIPARVSLERQERADRQQHDGH